MKVFVEHKFYVEFFKFRIESEDQLDTAKKPGDDDKNEDKEDADCKEENGIDMSEDFDSKLQDVEKRGDDSDESEQSDNEEEPDKQMGETEDGADKYELFLSKFVLELVK